jgi:hypothetical protein
MTVEEWASGFVTAMRFSIRVMGEGGGAPQSASLWCPSLSPETAGALRRASKRFCNALNQPRPERTNALN